MKKPCSRLYSFELKFYSQNDKGNGSATTLPLEVFTHKKFVAEFIRFKFIFIHKNEKFTF